MSEDVKRQLDAVLGLLRQFEAQLNGLEAIVRAQQNQIDQQTRIVESLYADRKRTVQ